MVDAPLDAMTPAQDVIMRVRAVIIAAVDVQVVATASV